MHDSSALGIGLNLSSLIGSLRKNSREEINICSIMYHFVHGLSEEIDDGKLRAINDIAIGIAGMNYTYNIALNECKYIFPFKGFYKDTKP